MIAISPYQLRRPFAARPRFGTQRRKTRRPHRGVRPNAGDVGQPQCRDGNLSCQRSPPQATAFLSIESADTGAITSAFFNGIDPKRTFAGCALVTQRETEIGYRASRTHLGGLP